MKGVRRRRTQSLGDLRNRKRCWDLKEEIEDQKGGKNSLLQQRNEDIQVI